MLPKSQTLTALKITLLYAPDKRLQKCHAVWIHSQEKSAVRRYISLSAVSIMFLTSAGYESWTVPGRRLLCPHLPAGRGQEKGLSLVVTRPPCPPGEKGVSLTIPAVSVGLIKGSLGQWQGGNPSSSPDPALTPSTLLAHTEPSAPPGHYS